MDIPISLSYPIPIYIRRNCQKWQSLNNFSSILSYRSSSWTWNVYCTCTGIILPGISVQLRWLISACEYWRERVSAFNKIITLYIVIFVLLFIWKVEWRHIQHSLPWIYTNCGIDECLPLHIGIERKFSPSFRCRVSSCLFSFGSKSAVLKKTKVVYASFYPVFVLCDGCGWCYSYCSPPAASDLYQVQISFRPMGNSEQITRIRIVNIL